MGCSKAAGHGDGPSPLHRVARATRSWPVMQGPAHRAGHWQHRAVLLTPLLQTGSAAAAVVSPEAAA